MISCISGRKAESLHHITLFCTITQYCPAIWPTFIQGISIIFSSLESYFRFLNLKFLIAAMMSGIIFHAAPETNEKPLESFTTLFFPRSVSSLIFLSTNFICLVKSSKKYLLSILNFRRCPKVNSQG